MTATAVPAPPAVTPRRPWNRKRFDAARAVTIVIIAALAAWAITSTTGLSGFLGWYIGLTVAMPVLSLVEAIRNGLNVAIDRFVSTLISVTAVAVAIPLFSIVREVWENGSKAFYSGYLTNDMRITASSEAGSPPDSSSTRQASP